MWQPSVPVACLACLNDRRAHARDRRSSWRFAAWTLKPAPACPPRRPRASWRGSRSSLRLARLSLDGPRSLRTAASWSTPSIKAWAREDRSNACSSAVWINSMRRRYLEPKAARSPFFSPDGQSVGFQADGKIKKVSVAVAAASAVVVIDEKMFMGATWAPDNTIIFGSIEHGLQRVSADGGVPQPVTTPDRARSEIDHHFPKLLPGGKAVMFTIHQGSERFRVGAQVLATGERKVLIDVWLRRAILADRSSRLRQGQQPVCGAVRCGPRSR